MRVYKETFDQAANILPDQAFYEVIRRIGLLLTKRDIFAHYAQGNFVIMRSNTSLVQMQNLVKKSVQSLMSEEWLTPECPASSLRISTQICSVRQNKTNSSSLSLVAAD